MVMEQNKLEELHYHASGGRYFEVQSLVNEGVALNVRNSDGQTPLMVAAKGSHREIVVLLINSGADIHCCEDNGWTLLHQASYEGWVQIAQYLVIKGVALDKNFSGNTPLMVAAKRSHREVVELLLNSGADIDCYDAYGGTVLHRASYVGSVEIVQSLVNKGVALDAKQSGGLTAMMLAAFGTHRTVVELLIKSGADIHNCDDDGWTVLHYASVVETVDIIDCFVHKGVFLDTKNSKGETPLHLAVQFDMVEIAGYLLKAGADSNLEDNEGKSPFNYLIKQNMPNIETIKLCIEKGAYVKPTDYRKLKGCLLKRVILEDVRLCTQAVINTFNNKDLPLLYKELESAKELPYINNMKIGNRSRIAFEIEQAVTHEIQAKGFCNVLDIVPLVLSILSVKSFNQGNPSE